MSEYKADDTAAAASDAADDELMKVLEFLEELADKFADNETDEGKLIQGTILECCDRLAAGMHRSGDKRPLVKWVS
jgi:hypothetical protein